MSALGTHQSGFGGFDWHERVATRFGFHYTHSGEDRQSQPNTDLFENVTIRLSDGNSIFESALFGPGIVVTHATYRMVAAEAAAKYHGFSLEATGGSPRSSVSTVTPGMCGSGRVSTRGRTRRYGGTARFFTSVVLQSAA